MCGAQSGARFEIILTTLRRARALGSVGVGWTLTPLKTFKIGLLRYRCGAARLWKIYS